MHFSYVHNILNEDNAPKPEFAKRYKKSVSKLYDELVWFADTLKTSRVGR